MTRVRRHKEELATLLIAGLALFLFTSALVLMREPILIKLDSAVRLYLSYFFVVSDEMIYLVSLIIIVGLFLALTAAIVHEILFRRSFLFMIVSAGALATGIVTKSALKDFFAIDRPLGGFAVFEGYSFPSGHATYAGIIAILLVSFCVHRFAKYNAKICAVIVFVSAVFVCFSRIIFSAHWFADVWGGGFLGGFFSSAWLLIFEFEGEGKRKNKLLNFMSRPVRDFFGRQSK